MLFPRALPCPIPPTRGLIFAFQRFYFQMCRRLSSLTEGTILFVALSSEISDKDFFLFQNWQIFRKSELRPIFVRLQFISEVQSVLRHFVDTFCSHFQKKWIRGLQTCRKILIRSALKSTDPGSSNGGSNFEIGPLEADLVSFEVARLPEKMARLGRSNSKLSQNALENGKLKVFGKGRRKFRTSAQRPHKVPKRVWVRIVPESEKNFWGLGFRLLEKPPISRRFPAFNLKLLENVSNF